MIMASQRTLGRSRVNAWNKLFIWLLKLNVRNTPLTETVYVCPSSTRNNIVELQHNYLHKITLA